MRIGGIARQFSPGSSCKFPVRRLVNFRRSSIDIKKMGKRKGEARASREKFIGKETAKEGGGNAVVRLSTAISNGIRSLLRGATLITRCESRILPATGL